MLVQQGEGSGTPTKPHHTPSPEAQSPLHTTHTSLTLPSVTTTSLPTITLTETTPIRQYTRRARIAQSFVLPTVADEPASSQRDVSQGEACPTDSGFIADQDRATIDKSSTLPHDSALRVTSLVADEGIQQGEGSGTPTKPHHTPSPEAQSPLHTTHTSLTLPSVTTTSLPTITLTETTPIRQYTRRARIAQSFVLPTVADEPASSQRDVSQGEACPTDSGFIADQDRATIDKSSTLPHDSALRVTSLVADEGKINRLKERVKLLEDRERVAAIRSGDDTPIKGRSMDEGKAATEMISDDSKEMATVLTSINVATVLASEVVDVPTSSGSIPIASTPTEEQVPTGSDVVPTASPIFATATVVTPYRKRKGKEVMVESETPKKQKEYHQFASKLPMERRIELITELVKYQDNYAKIYKYQSQLRKSMSKKQKRDYYMAVIKNNLGWKVKDFRGMAFEEMEAKFNSVWKQMEDFIPMGSKEEAERIKRK
nr:hypothetical protein [Tanacetum cinerariifolium]